MTILAVNGVCLVLVGAGLILRKSKISSFEEEVKFATRRRLQRL